MNNMRYVPLLPITISTLVMQQRMLSKNMVTKLFECLEDAIENSERPILRVVGQTISNNRFLR